MKSLCVFVLIAACICTDITLAGNQPSKIQSVSLTAGAYLINLKDFDKVYDSKMIFIFGANVGIPISDNVGFYLKGNYLRKNGTPVVRTYVFDKGQIVGIKESREGSAKFSMLLFNFGLQYSFLNIGQFKVAANGGMTYSKIYEVLKNIDGNEISRIKGGGIIGLFLGGMIGREFKTKPFSVFSEIQYVFSRRDLVGLVGDYGGLNLNIGLRYYFNK